MSPGGHLLAVLHAGQDGSHVAGSPDRLLGQPVCALKPISPEQKPAASDTDSIQVRAFGHLVHLQPMRWPYVHILTLESPTRLFRRWDMYPWRLLTQIVVLISRARGDVGASARERQVYVTLWHICSLSHSHDVWGVVCAIARHHSGDVAEVLQPIHGQIKPQQGGRSRCFVSGAPCAVNFGCTSRSSHA